MKIINADKISYRASCPIEEKAGFFVKGYNQAIDYVLQKAVEITEEDISNVIKNGMNYWKPFYEGIFYQEISQAILKLLSGEKVLSTCGEVTAEKQAKVEKEFEREVK